MSGGLGGGGGGQEVMDGYQEPLIRQNTSDGKSLMRIKPVSSGDAVICSEGS